MNRILKNHPPGRGGFTLVEMMVALMCCAVVTMAVVTLTLMGLRMENQAQDVAGRRQNAQIVLSMLENLASEGEIKTVLGLKAGTADGSADSGQSGWVLLDKDNDQLLSYGNKTLSNGDSVLLANLDSSSVKLDKKNHLLTFQITEDGKTYSSTIYTRLGAEGNTEITPDQTQPEQPDEQEEPSDNDPSGGTPTSQTGNLSITAKEFLTKLLSQYKSEGIIMGGENAGKYYAKWYNNEWKENTAWCAIFLNWGLDESKSNNVLDYANVDSLMNAFKNGGTGYSWTERKTGENVNIPQAGDYIFFDWNNNNDPDHVGAVLTVDTVNEIVYTIEGNSGTPGRVAVRAYSLGSDYIVGYGTPPWKTTEAPAAE